MASQTFVVYDAKDPDYQTTPIEQLRAPSGGKTRGGRTQVQRVPYQSDLLGDAAGPADRPQPPLFAEGATVLSLGEHQVRMEFAYEGGGLGKGGKVVLYVDGKKDGEGVVGTNPAMIFSAVDGKYVVDAVEAIRMAPARQ